MVQRKLVDSLPVVGSPAVADRTLLVDSLLEADRSRPVGNLLAVVLDGPVGSHLVGNNYPVGNLPVVDSHLADNHRRTDLAGWDLVPGQDSNS